MQRFDRIMGLLLYLRSEQRTSAAALANRFEVSTRTIHRDVELLSALGVPVYAERGRGGGIRLLPGYFLPPVMLTTGEATSLILGLAALSSLRARPFEPEIESAHRKLLAALPDHLRDLMRDVGRAVGFERAPSDIFHPEREAGPGDTSRAGVSEGQVVTAFLQALFDSRTVRLRYVSPYRPEPATEQVEPQAVFWDRDRWYLVGVRQGDNAHRVWRADRVTHSTPDGPSTGATAIDVRDLLDRAWLRPAMRRWAVEAPVTIELTPQQSNRLKQDWYYRHASFDELPSGRVRMTYGEDDLDLVFELLRWLGPGAELIEPMAWRARLRVDLLHMADAHADEPG